ncbi:MAG: chromosome segregation protein SMC [Bacillaceae bacterium]|nr:chromosome segregation protein SMC [Bacillaceae bacterium]
MRLKRLELTGFKSFADRTELEFVPGITAVVGPNGSGKSNISDAIRWVLGEQSAKSLRGAKMEDIIFSGSDSRKPVNFCEVSLTLDNTDGSLDIDYAEVTITRRVYRSGDSEYFINKQHCRMKDIVELFMDTGVGKEAYSIIGQGRIEEILSSKSEDRRAIFEEAAGIVKYKTRKKEAEKKLEDTRQNLDRIQDIIAEIEEQIEPLEQQADKARKYLDYKKELKQNEVSLYVYQIEDLHRKWNESKQKLSDLKDRHAELSSEVSSRDACMEELRWNVNELDKQLDESQKNLLIVSEEVEKKEGHREVLKERKRNYSQNKTSLTETIEKLKNRLDTIQKQMDEEKAKRDETYEHLQEAEQNLQLELEELEGISQSLENNVDKLKEEYNEILNRISTIRNDIRHYSESAEHNEKKRTSLEQENHRILEIRKQVEQRHKSLTQQLQMAETELSERVETYKQTVSQLKESVARRDQLHKELRQWQQKQDTLSSRLELLKEMQSDYSGFFQGVKEILKNRDTHLQGIHGAVAELIEVPKDYEIALETALGSALQHVVVEDEKAGRDAIAFLKKRNLGRATFLPLDVIRSRFLNQQDEQKIAGDPGIVGIASRLVKFAPTYQKIVENLLGTVLITRTLEDANRVARLLHYKYRLVTLDGDVVNPGGSMTGGTSRQKNTSLLGRQRQVEQLEDELVQVRSQIEDVEKRITETDTSISTLEQKQEELRSEGEQLRVREQELKGQLDQAAVEKKNVDERLTHYDREKAGYDKEIEQARNQIHKLQDELKAAEQAAGQKKEDIARAEKLQREKETSREEMSSRITDLKVRVAEIRQKYESRVQNYSRLEQEYQEIRLEHEQALNELEQLEHQMENSGDEEERTEQEIEEKRGEKEKLAYTIQTLREKRQSMQKDLEHLELENREFRKQLNETENRLHQEEVRVNRFDVELDNLLNKLSEDYELTYERAKEEYPPPENIEEVRSRVQSIKQKIVMLGTVNLGAIEEHERLSERFNFLTGQREDLLKAMDTLYQVIQEMNEEMSRRFEQTFEEIRSHFNDVFNQLFGGGRADLQLSEPDNLLQTGIDIVAQPPGKKLQHLALLSGGEKALTAIALLFSILRVKPVPFCVLDEVEAALDEANVTRFARYLREFCEQTQFIVVTHRKGTMEESDVLYGITMQESGVSRLVSVRLEDQEKLLNESA